MVVRALFLFVVAVSTTLALPLACVPGTLGDYISLPADGCSIGPAIVSDFALSVLTPGSVEIPSADVQIDPLFDLFNQGLLFSYGASAGPGEVKESALEFKITADFGSLTFGSLRAGGMSALGDGAVVGSSEFCFGTFSAGLCSDASVAAIVGDAGGAQVTFDRQTFAAISTLTVRQDVVLDGGLSGSASLESAEVRFGVVPEPATVGTVAMALVAAIFIHGRRRR